jgi:1-phosphatidylinositol-3-phosphate 5-kinase
MKELSKAEFDSLLSFAPLYFQYLAETLFQKLPTTLAKIFGVFRLFLKNQLTGKSIKMDVLVMENLFHGRQVDKVFDLKGSIRNRSVTETGKRLEVLMDKNWIKCKIVTEFTKKIHSNPLLI